MLHQVHFSNAQVARIFPICEKCKQTTATIYHMLWSCSKLVPFWLSMFNTMSQTYGYNIQSFPLVASFGTVPDSEDGSFQAYLQRVVAFSSLLVRRSVLFKWKDTTPPTQRWIRDIMQNIKVEKNRCTPSGSLQALDKTGTRLQTMSVYYQAQDFEVIESWSVQYTNIFGCTLFVCLFVYFAKIMF